jgi:hypothetical protein
MNTRMRVRSWSRLLLVAAVIHLSPGIALAEAMASAEPEGVGEVQSDDGGIDAAQIGASTLDAVLIRPLGALATAVGLGMFVVSSPFVAPSRDFGTTWDIFVVGPAEYTFQRPLGTI